MQYLTKDSYFTNRRSIESGDLLVWEGQSWLSKFIRRWTASTYSHVGIALVIGERIFILEAVEGKGVSITPLSSRLPFYHIKTKVPWTPTLEANALSKLGAPYSYVDALLSGLSFKPTQKGYQCVEYAAEILGVTLDQNLPSTIVNHFLEKESIY